jgi:hypothetical protein
MNSVKVQPYMIDVKLAGKTVSMELDTGASRSAVSEKVYKRCFNDRPVQNTNVVLRSCTNEIIMSVPVTYRKQAFQLHVIVVMGDCAAL